MLRHTRIQSQTAHVATMIFSTLRSLNRLFQKNVKRKSFSLYLSVSSSYLPSTIITNYTTNY